MENTEENIQPEINIDSNPIVEQEPIDPRSNQQIEIDPSVAQPQEQDNQAREADDRSPEENTPQEGDPNGGDEGTDAN